MSLDHLVGSSEHSRGHPTPSAFADLSVRCVLDSALFFEV